MALHWNRKVVWLHITYLLWVLLLGFFVVPCVLSISFNALPFALNVALTASVGLAIGGITAGYSAKPQGFWPRYWPMLFFTVVPGVVVIAGMLMAQGSTQGFWYVSAMISPGFFLGLISEALWHGFVFSPLAPVVYGLAYGAGFMWYEQRKPNPAPIPRWLIPLAAVLAVALLASGAFMYWQRTINYVPKSHGFAYERGYSSVDLTPYKPGNPENSLPTLPKPASFRIEKEADMPVLDGAEAAFPVYAAFAKNCYALALPPQATSGQGEGKVANTPARQADPFDNVVSFTNTINAYERLLRGKVDIFFGAEPSAAQRALAAEKGVELVLTPIGNEAFVFFVGRENPLTSLTQDQIRAIYSGKVRNWQEFGGADARIWAFQRPEDSGSQTIMKKFMGQVPLVKPLQEEYSSGMGGTVEKVASFRNVSGSLGYSFRFFATSMYTGEVPALLALDGVAPAPENISNGTYPWVVPLYAVTLKNNPKPTVAAFVRWMQGPEGQELVEAVGYSRYK